MMEIRKKDKVFAAVVLPLVLIGGYVYFWRMPLARRIADLAEECRRLPDPDAFPVERRDLLARTAEAEKERTAAQAEKPAEPAVEGDAQTAVARRLQQAVSVLTGAGVRIVRVDDATAEGGPAAAAAESSRGAAVLEATGIRPVPAARRFAVEADYPDLVTALEAFARRKMAVVPEALSLTAGDRTCRWEVTLWL
ncbi:MAG: hypothetical protein ACI4Q3_02540 [Kiritimatiellia bacterium]